MSNPQQANLALLTSSPSPPLLRVTAAYVGVALLLPDAGIHDLQHLALSQRHPRSSFWVRDWKVIFLLLAKKCFIFKIFPVWLEEDSGDGYWWRTLPLK